MASFIAFVIVVYHVEFVAEKVGRVCPSMGNRGFLFGEGEFQPVQYLTQLVLDFLGFFTWSGKTEQDIIGIPTVSEASVRGIGGIQRGKLVRFASECLGRLWLTIRPQPTGLLHEFEVGWIVASPLTLVIDRKKVHLNRFIKPIQVDVGQ